MYKKVQWEKPKLPEGVKIRYRMSKEQIAQVVEMRRQGHLFTEIGLLFGKDHTTIVYH